MHETAARVAGADPQGRGVSERFAAAAGQLAGLAGRFLGWRPDEFWNATPAELAAILLPPEGLAENPLGRAELARLMEQDND